MSHEIVTREEITIHRGDMQNAKSERLCKSIFGNLYIA